MMKQSSWQSLAFLVLIGLNLSLIGFLMWGPSASTPPPGPEGGPGHGRPGMGPPPKLDRFLKQELGWDADQMAQFERAKAAHLEESQRLRQQMWGLRQELHALDQSQPEAVAALLDQVGQQQRLIEASMWEHFQELRAICTPEQLPQFDRLKQDLLLPPDRPPRRRP
jgi:protein CpxP